jgi:hypothetical protein
LRAARKNIPICVRTFPTCSLEEAGRTPEAAAAALEEGTLDAFAVADVVGFAASPEPQL